MLRPAAQQNNRFHVCLELIWLRHGQCNGSCVWFKQCRSCNHGLAVQCVARVPGQGLATRFLDFSRLKKTC